MLCYRFEETEHEVSPCKKARMQPSTLKAIKKKLKSGKSSRDVYVEARHEAGDLSASKVSSRPRSINQVQKRKERSIHHQSSNYTARPGQKDELYSVILKCIDDSTHFHRFLRFVQGAPQPLAFLADDSQLLDLERFCTNPSRPGILSIDTTYNRGEFYVTPTTYRHQMLLSKRTGKHPVLLGPTLIHKHRDQEAFGYLASSMIRLKPSLARMLAVGCDRDKAIKNGLTPHFPCAVFLACKKHFEDDIQRKLTELGVNGNERKEIVADIFGSEVTRERGLIDRATELEFEKDLAELEQVWNDREKAARRTSAPEFHSWFVRYQAKDMKEMLLYPVRWDIGLGYDFYYNNDPESVHRNIKADRTTRPPKCRRLLKTSARKRMPISVMLKILSLVMAHLSWLLGSHILKLTNTLGHITGRKRKSRSICASFTKPFPLIRCVSVRRNQEQTIATKKMN